MRQKYITGGVLKWKKKSLRNCKNELMIVFFYDFCHFILLNVKHSGENREH